jgi:hypothetical protein
MEPILLPKKVASIYRFQVANVLGNMAGQEGGPLQPGQEGQQKPPGGSNTSEI